LYHGWLGKSSTDNMKQKARGEGVIENNAVLQAKLLLDARSAGKASEPS